ncbi:SGNH/GDSL hydrolase family protein [Nocardioides pacificus]
MGPGRGYLRFAALGDSTTYGIGDPHPRGHEPGWRGWARLLAGALATSYDVSHANLAVTGATAAAVRDDQLEQAVAHRPDLASLIVGINDTMRSSWDPHRLRDDLLTCAQQLDASGAELVTARFHDHGAVFGLPGVLRRPLWARIERVNAVYDEIHTTYGGLRLDLAALPEVHDRRFWSIDRLHPSERGHRVLARRYAELLHGAGLSFEPPTLEPDGGHLPSRRDDVAWLVTEGAPWLGRRTRDLAPWAVRAAWAGGRQRAGRTEPREPEAARIGSRA